MVCIKDTDHLSGDMVNHIIQENVLSMRCIFDYRSFCEINSLTNGSDLQALVTAIKSFLSDVEDSTVNIYTRHVELPCESFYVIIYEERFIYAR